ncbi:MAG: hypothetical protein INR73_26980 [Williamsia sp.]|nr:hypothetical protein [Williamsia sp.]
MKTIHRRMPGKPENASPSEVHSRLHPLMEKAAEMLQRKAAKLSSHNKWLGLMLFCLLSVGCSLGVIVYSVRTAHPFFSVEPIRPPVPFKNPHRMRKSEDSVVTMAQYKRIQAIESFLSRQQNHPATKAFYDSLVKARPGFPDSLKAIDSLFLSQ